MEQWMRNLESARIEAIQDNKITARQVLAHPIWDTPRTLTCCFIL